MPKSNFLPGQTLGAIGDYKHSSLTEPQFQTIYGTGWVLVDGRNVAGSAWATLTGQTVLPDGRGQFLRGANNGGSAAGTRADGNQNPDGTALHGFQSDQVVAHTHTLNANITSGATGAFNSVPGGSAAGSAGTILGGVANTTGGNETRPKNITTNIFIRIN
jgi:hypothetical protein